MQIRPLAGALLSWPTGTAGKQHGLAERLADRIREQPAARIAAAGAQWPAEPLAESPAELLTDRLAGRLAMMGVGMLPLVPGADNWSAAPVPGGSGALPPRQVQQAEALLPPVPAYQFQRWGEGCAVGLERVTRADGQMQFLLHPSDADVGRALHRQIARETDKGTRPMVLADSGRMPSAQRPLADGADEELAL